MTLKSMHNVGGEDIHIPVRTENACDDSVIGIVDRAQGAGAAIRRGGEAGDGACQSGEQE